MDRQRAALFCLLTFAISWTWWGIRLSPGWAQVLAGQSIDRANLGALDVQVGMFGPLLAALALRVWDQRRAGARGRQDGLLASLRPPRTGRALLLAWMIPVGVVGTAVLVSSGLGPGRFTWAGASPVELVGSFLLINLLAALTAVGEEYGWRGYLLPRLLPAAEGRPPGWRPGNEIRATLAVGLVWAAWHLPLLAAGLTFPGQPVWMATAVFSFALVMFSFPLTWVYRWSGGSMWAAALMHGTFNALTELTSPRHIPDASPLVGHVFGLASALVVLLVVIVYYNWGGKELVK